MKLQCLLRIFFFFLLLCASTFSYAQYNDPLSYFPKPRDVQAKKVIDHTQFVVNYQLSLRYNTNHTGILRDSMALNVGEQFSKFYSITSDLLDSSVYKQIVINDRALLTLGVPENGVYTYLEVYTNSSKMSRDVYHRFGCQDYYYTESIINNDWVIINKDTLLLGYQCTKAQLKTQDYLWTVWFAKDLPSAGPWKLDGVPGLVLLAYDEQRVFTWKAYEVLMHEKRPIYCYMPTDNDPPYSHYIPDYTATKITKEEIDKLWRRRWLYPESVRCPFYENTERILLPTGKYGVVTLDENINDAFYPKLD